MIGKGVDPVTFELIRNALGSIVDEMTLTVVRTAYSSNLKNSMDFSTGFLNAECELVVQGMCLPLHLGSLPDALHAILARHGGKIDPGDVFALNDPFEGGTHLPDIYVVKPIFIDNDFIGCVATIAHHSDVGGKVAGGNASDCTEIYQEGLRIPPVKLYQKGEPNNALFELIVPRLQLTPNVYRVHCQTQPESETDVKDVLKQSFR